MRLHEQPQRDSNPCLDLERVVQAPRRPASLSQRCWSSPIPQCHEVPTVAPACPPIGHGLGTRHFASVHPRVRAWCDLPCSAMAARHLELLSIESSDDDIRASLPRDPGQWMLRRARRSAPLRRWDDVGERRLGNYFVMHDISTLQWIAEADVHLLLQSFQRNRLIDVANAWRRYFQLVGEDAVARIRAERRRRARRLSSRRGHHRHAPALGRR
jgi:hypothetical protein